MSKPTQAKPARSRATQARKPRPGAAHTTTTATAKSRRPRPPREEATQVAIDLPAPLPGMWTTSKLSLRSARPVQARVGVGKAQATRARRSAPARRPAVITATITRQRKRLARQAHALIQRLQVLSPRNLHPRSFWYGLGLGVAGGLGLAVVQQLLYTALR